MAASQAGQLSSNWKKLQAQLQTAKKADSASNGLKRKRPAEKNGKATTGHKKVRFSGENATALGKKRKMGGSMSSQPASSQPKPLSTLSKDHDISAADLSAAYGGSTGQGQTVFKDEINGGLHPTHKAGKYLALDCEMVGTGPPPHSDDILARVSLVNFHGEQIYDSYVQPPPGAKVEDYRTFVSGIQPFHLSPSHARPFTQVQKDVAALLQDRILVGHALRKDMQALLLSHPKRDVRDTSRHPKFRIESRGKPPALRNLAKSELGMTIQTGEHSSVEDARATMMLFKKEKQGFEEENRRTFGQSRPRRVEKRVEREVEVDEDEDEEDEELETLDGEEDDELEDDEEGGTGDRAAAPKAKKKRKKKKRTKRK